MSSSFIDTLVDPYFKLLPYELASVLAGMVWGQKTFLNEQQYELFQKTGLLHLLVLSGQNITLLIAFFNSIADKFGRKVKLIATIFVALFYFITFGNEPSIIRASIMATLASLSMLYERRTSTLYILLITSVIMIIIWPSWLSNISFQLSFGATLGIITIYPLLKKCLKSPLFDTLFLSFSAQLFTTPLILLYFRETSLITLPMNVLVAWLTEPIMFLGFLLSTIGQLIAPLSQLIAFFLLGIMKFFLFIVQSGYSLGILFSIKI